MKSKYDRARCGRCGCPLAQEDLDAHERHCLECRIRWKQKLASGYCARCNTPLEDPRNHGRNLILTPGKDGICIHCRERNRQNELKRRTRLGSLSQVWRRMSKYCPVCGEKAMAPVEPRLQCARCGYFFHVVPKHTVVAPIGRLTREQQHQAKRCPACNKKRLLAASERRYECHGCGQCYLRSEQARADWIRPKPVKEAA